MASTSSINWAAIIKAVHAHRMEIQSDTGAGKTIAEIADVVGSWTPVMSSDQAAVYYSKEFSAFVKIFYETRFKHKLKNKLFPFTSRHKRFIDRTKELHDLNIPAPKIITSGIIDRNGYVVTSAFPGMGLGSFFTRYLSLESKACKIYRWRRNAIGLLGELVANLHNAGVAHGDLRPNNILLNCHANTPSFCFIDNERNTKAKQGLSRRLSDDAVIKNLVQLNMIWLDDVCLSDRFRFVRSYFQTLNKDLYVGLDNKAGQRKLIKKVQIKTAGRLIGKPKDGYRKNIGFEPFVPDLNTLLAE
ncbi:MAG: lipopolysaccharide kinase InaA family protein [Cellvibrionaceae bacterium]